MEDAISRHIDKHIFTVGLGKTNNKLKTTYTGIQTTQEEIYIQLMMIYIPFVIGVLYFFLRLKKISLFESLDVLVYLCDGNNNKLSFIGSLSQCYNFLPLMGNGTGGVNR